MYALSLFDFIHWLRERVISFILFLIAPMGADCIVLSTMMHHLSCVI